MNKILNKNGPIVIIEDDEDDIDFLKLAFSELQLHNKVIYFRNGLEAFQYFVQPGSSPFIIISDINMPIMTGIQLKDKLLDEGTLNLRMVPFLFLTTGAASDTIINIYANSVQGFFRKEANFSLFKQTIRRIVEYWNACATPSITN
ncbi:MAG: response regulator [Ferruginibacter sp.]